VRLITPTGSVATPSEGAQGYSAAVAYTSLSRVMSRLQAVLTPALDRAFWLRAELSNANERNGAFYGELVETDRQSGTVVAKLRCTIWRRDLQQIRARFARAGLELELESGHVVGVQCVVQFHTVHGLSLRVLDMDPAFVLGELELRRRRILAGLEGDGLLRCNAAQPVPLLPNSILLITSSVGAAYHDFTRALAGSRFGFSVYLADSTMQGPRTEDSVLATLALSARLPVDLVVLIRGGGSQTDLGWLNSDALARCIARCPKPVWTGIGHETDTSVLDAVAAQSFRTPTAAAEALIARFERVATRLDEAEARMHSVFAAADATHRDRLSRSTTSLRRDSEKLLVQHRAELTGGAHKLHARATVRVTGGRSTLQAYAHRVQQRTSHRIGIAQRERQQLQGKLAACVPRAVERRARALHEGRMRFERLHLAESLIAQRSRLDTHQAVLQRGSARLLAAARADLDGDAEGLRSRLAARVSVARMALAPRVQQLRRLLDLRTQTAAARLELVHERLDGAASRAVKRIAATLEHARERLSQERVLARCDRERALLAQHSRVLRASDPRRALERGYSLTYTASGSLIRSAREMVAGQTVMTELADGRVAAIVQTVTTEEGEDG
jgi:exodeoxyribonuclease VII large subunit